MGWDRIDGDGKRPDRITIFPFRDGKCHLWDTICGETLIKSAIDLSIIAWQDMEYQLTWY